MRTVLAAVLMAATSTALAAASITFVCCAHTPSTASIAQGEIVSWSGAFGSHPLRQVIGPTSDTLVPGGFASSLGAFFSQQFTTPGTCYFQCSLHGQAQVGGTMRGSVVVLGAPADPMFANGFE